MGQMGNVEGFAEGILNWVRWLGNQAASSFQSGLGGGMLAWFSGNWLKLLLVLIVIGIAIDWLVWMVRWRPYWLWFNKKRVLLDDERDEQDDEDEVFYENDEDDFVLESDAPHFQSKALRRDKSTDAAEDEEWFAPKGERSARKPVEAQWARDSFDADDADDEDEEDFELDFEVEKADKRKVEQTPVARRITGLFHELKDRKSADKDAEEDEELFFDDNRVEMSGDEDEDDFDFDFDFEDEPVEPETPDMNVEFAREDLYARLAEKEGWHTGYTGSVPVVSDDAGAPALSRKMRRRIEEAQAAERNRERQE